VTSGDARAEPARWAAFGAVGAIGFGVQIAAVAWLTRVAGWADGPATAAAVALAVLHNFLWHERWTWRDRTAAGRGVVARFARFTLVVGTTSVVANVILTTTYSAVFGVTAVTANTIAVASIAVVNFVLADRAVFTRAALVLALCTWAPPASAAQPSVPTLGAWNAYVRVTEARIQRESAAGRPAPFHRHLLQSDTMLVASVPAPDGSEPIVVPGGLIHHWHGAVLVPNATLDEVLDGLMHPGTPPPQDDVIAARVVARSNEGWRVYLRLVRRTIVRVTYDTEHDVTFRRLSPMSAISCSVAVKIVELENAGTGRERPIGDDHGFLWRLNSYWRYEQAGDGVVVEMESLTLSRDAPAIVRALAGPIIAGVARDSMRRTLEAVRRRFGR
jgi:putative flippase GtrA